MIIEELFGSTTRVTAPELWDRIRDRGDQVSLATVQLTLKRLVEHGLANVVRHGGALASFSPIRSEIHHGRLVCTACRTVTSFIDDRIEGLHVAIARNRGFQIQGHKLEIYGVCDRCLGSSDTR